MFSVGPMELLLVLILALLIFGPQKIPEIAAGLGQAIREFRRASQELSEALALSQTVGAPDIQAAAWNGLGLVAWAQGELELAAVRLAEGLRCVTGLAYPRVVAFLLGNLALVALDRGQTALALTQAQECLRRFQRLGSRWGMGLYLLVLGAVLAARGQPARGVRLISAGLSGLAAIGAQVPGYAQGRLAREIAGLRRALGEAA